MDAKYIVIRCHEGEFAFVFPPLMAHRDIAQAIQTSRDNLDCGLRASTVVAGGFISDTGKCYGESESLKVKSRGPVDEVILANGCLGKL